MKILVINAGSTTLKYQLIDSENESVIAKGLCERIGGTGQISYNKRDNTKGSETVELPDHGVALKLVIERMTDPNFGVISDLKEIDAVGHRVVHGGERFSSSVVVNDEVLADIEKCSDLAPLHNPANILGIKACMSLMPGVPNVAVFDTAFHQTMPEKAYMYGLPYEYYEKYKVRRYGFHGTSHSFVSKRVIELLGKPAEDTKVIVCHLGGGASISAVCGGKSVDTSMGMTPLEGILMGTRSGSIDPAIIEYIANKEGKNINEIMTILNKKSGLLGISGTSSDFRDIDDGYLKGDPRATIAFKAFCYQAAKIVGGYIAAMNGVDAIAFTAGIGEHDALAREEVLSYFGYLGIKVNKEVNDKCHDEALISTEDSKVKVYAVPTNEELAIARETVMLCK
ncbi:acetate kinase [Eubacterium ruminantium]|uniref:Acetate kinase n=1 Tax=Eubacterium ruminantium TaxID=42322 RepID=A0A1T4PFB5_9FIRM|nr:MULTISPECIES: acetate kinase [Eubacterium]MCR5368837.1 acetate kinase [Eubacterium sp.]SCW57907.1 acetate kinase [Eubacterium ruminantium]SDN00704.1 acetate kinase [Eubacterium ruminantium]SJZ89498.1 acetate kinase [Eubacterium ruminantium]